MGAKTNIVGIGGGTASGKTTLARRLFELAGPEVVSLVPLDCYYRCHGHLTPDERARVNYDHPHAFEADLLAQHLAMLQDGASIEMPMYDFSTHSRSDRIITIAPSPIVIVEGILALHFDDLRRRYAYSIFVDTPSELRLSRRASRDVKERGRTVDSVHRQWNETVNPMYSEFCEPTRESASLVVSGETMDEDSFVSVLEKLKAVAGV